MSIQAPTARAAELVTIERFVADGPEWSDREDYEAEAMGWKGPPAKVEIATLPPLTLEDWRARDLPAPDFIMGQWLTTTSRVLLTAATGLGKTNFGLAVAMRAAAGMPFLHWLPHRAVRVLYIDGEMSRRLLRQRVLDEALRLGTSPETFFALSHEDVQNFKPLNTPEGQAWINALIDKIGGVDLIIFDNIMSLTIGDMKDPEPWQQTLPFALSLTKREIGQIWIHHTGHDETRSYGDKSREWQMDTVAHLDAVKRDDTDLSFAMKFGKARERTPATRFDFQEVKIALVSDRWEHELTQAKRPDKVNAQAARALDALMNVMTSDSAVTTTGNRRAATREAWIAELTVLGMIDPAVKAASARSLFNRWRRELAAAFRIACEGDLSWPL
jgi:RecA-family ATPase